MMVITVGEGTDVALVGVAANLRREPGPGEPADRWAEFDSEETISAVADAISGAGHEVLRLEADESFLDLVRSQRLCMVFNMAEGIRGESRESHVPAVLEMLGIPYTGSGVLSLAAALDKPVAKRLFQAWAVPTPAFAVARPGQVPEVDLDWPLFVKPVGEGSSMGIGPGSLVRDRAQLVEAVDRIGGEYGQAALIERFCGGREFTVGVLGNDHPVTLPPLEVLFGDCPDDHGPIYSRQFKVEFADDRYYRCPAPVSPGLGEELSRLAVLAFRALDCRDVARVDLRLDDMGKPQVLEVNPLPGMAPGFSDLPRSAEVAGIGFAELVCKILDHAWSRYR